MHVKIVDFGLSTFVEPTTSATITRLTNVAATKWSAPELLSEGEMPTFASDVWAFGCACLLVSACDLDDCANVHVLIVDYELTDIASSVIRFGLAKAPIPHVTPCSSSKECSINRCAHPKTRTIPWIHSRKIHLRNSLEE